MLRKLKNWATRINLSKKLREWSLSKKKADRHEIHLKLVKWALGGVNMRKHALARVSYRDDFLLSYRVYMFECYFLVPWRTGRRHPELTKTTHVLQVPVERQTDLTPKRGVVSSSHINNVTKFLTGVKFSLRCNNRGELTPVWLAPARHFVVARLTTEGFTLVKYLGDGII